MVTDGVPWGGGWSRWLGLGIVAVALVTVAWACITAWGAIVHGHPAYAVVLAMTAVGAGVAARRINRRRSPATVTAAAGRVLLLVAGVAWITGVAWLRPFPAVEPAIGATASDAAVTVAESATTFTLMPAGNAADIGLVFQPGALVDPRAYAAILRPLAAAGYPVIIAKQPLGIAFLALGALDEARSDHPEISQWVVGGHSLGGVVASIQADGADERADRPAIGLLLYASYPASDVSASLSASVLSISGSLDGLSTPGEIEASRTDLPPDAEFVVIEGASHAQFGAYGSQPGDGHPTIGDAEAAERISEASVTFLDRLGR